MYIALLEDEESLAQHVKELLQSQGHVVRVFGNGNDLTAALSRDTVDLFILDWSVPGKSGLQVLQYVRDVMELKTPVLFMTARTFEEDIVSALSAGADDYCTKPVQPAVLLARINALLRRTYPSSKSESTRTLLGYDFNLTDHTVRYGGKTLSLPDKEFMLAVYFFENPDRALSRNRLMQKVWGDQGDLLSRALDVYVSGIRKKLNIGANSSHLRLRPIYGFGYRLMTVDSNDES